MFATENETVQETPKAAWTDNVNSSIGLHWFKLFISLKDLDIHYKTKEKGVSLSLYHLTFSKPTVYISKVG